MDIDNGYELVAADLDTLIVVDPSGKRSLATDCGRLPASTRKALNKVFVRIEDMRREARECVINYAGAQMAFYLDSIKQGIWSKHLNENLESLAFTQVVLCAHLGADDTVTYFRFDGEQFITVDGERVDYQSNAQCFIPTQLPVAIANEWRTHFADHKIIPVVLRQGV